MENKMNFLISNLSSRIEDTNQIDIITNGNFSIKNSQLMRLFEEKLKDIYWCDKELINSLSIMIKQASSVSLIEVLKIHLHEKREQINRIEEIFELIKEEPLEKKCISIETIISQSDILIKSSEINKLRDMEIISCNQKIEHYEIGVYATLCEFAESIGIKEVASILKKTLMEEIKTHKKLSEIAECI